MPTVCSGLHTLINYITRVCTAFSRSVIFVLFLYGGQTSGVNFAAETGKEKELSGIILGVKSSPRDRGSETY